MSVAAKLCGLSTEAAVSAAVAGGAAYLGFVQALPNFDDYLSAWQLAVPQFLMKLDYMAANDRFSQTFDPTRSFYYKMGWGFSFFGEAYMAMGLVGPVVIAMGFCAIAVAVHGAARRNQS